MNYGFLIGIYSDTNFIRMKQYFFSMLNASFLTCF